VLYKPVGVQTAGDIGSVGSGLLDRGWRTFIHVRLYHFPIQNFLLSLLFLHVSFFEFSPSHFALQQSSIQCRRRKALRMIEQ